MVPKCHPANGASYTTSSDQIYISFSLDRKLLQNFTSGDDNSSHLELLLMNKVLTECLGSLTMAFLAPKENNHIKLKCGSQPSINSSSKFQRNSAISPNRCNKRRKICKSSRENNQNGPLHSQNLEINGYRWDSDADSDVGGGGRQSPDENVDITSSDRKCRNSFDTTNYSMSGIHNAPQIPTKLLEFASVQHVVSDLAAAAARDNNNSSPLNLSSKTLNAKNLDNLLSSSSPAVAVSNHTQMPVSSQCVVPVPSITLLREMKKMTSSEENVFEIESSLSSSAAVAALDDGAESSSDSEYTSRSDDTAAMTEGASGSLLEEDDSVLDVSQENHSLLSPSMLTTASENITPSKLNKNVLSGQNDDLKGIAVVTPVAAPSGPMFHHGHGGGSSGVLIDGCNNLKLTQSLNELILEGIYGCANNNSNPHVTSSSSSRTGANSRHSSSRDQENGAGASRRASGAAVRGAVGSSSSKDDITNTASKLLQTAVAAAFLPKTTTTSSSSHATTASSVASTASTNKSNGGRAGTHSPPNLKSHSSNNLTTSINNNNILLVNQTSSSSKLSPPSTSPSNSSTSSSGASCNSSHAHATPPQSVPQQSCSNSGSTPRRGQKSLVCEFGCGYETPDATLLKSHHVSHSNDRPYQCSYCGHAFKRNHTLLRHIRQVHKIDTTSATGEAVFSVASMVTPQQSVTTMDIKSAAAAANLCNESSPSTASGSSGGGGGTSSPAAAASSNDASNASPSSRTKREAAAVAMSLLRAAAASNDAVMDCKLEGVGSNSSANSLTRGAAALRNQKRTTSSQLKDEDLYDDEAAELSIDDDDMDQPMDLAFGGCEDDTGEDSFLDLKPVFNLGNKSCNVLNMSTSGASSGMGKHASSNRTTPNSSSTAKLAAAAASLNLVMSM